MIILAAAPLVAVIAGILLKQSALRSSVIGVVVAAVIGAGWFSLTPSVAAAAAAEWWPLVVEVLLIVAGGIAFAEVGRRTGAQARISGWLRDALGAGWPPCSRSCTG